MSDVQLIQTPCVFGENGNFLLERELGRGGMGGVYLGRDKMLDRPVTVKVMLKEYGSDSEFVERFKKEAQAAARLIHPNIAQIYSYGIADDMPYISMELVAGGSLYQIMRNSGADSDVPRIMKICEQVAQALRCAADQGLVHGDIKPENVLLDSNGNAKLVDFGLAAMQKDTDEIWGTPYYIAPEKVRKEPVDYRADMYSLGGTLYHALCGVAPFEGEDASSVVRKRFEFIPRKPSEIRKDLSPQIDALIMRMLAFNPGDRYPSFEALLADFRAVMTVGLSASQILTPMGSPEKTSSPASGGKKKLTLKAKKKLTIKSPSSSDGEGDCAEEDDQERSGKRYKFKTNPGDPSTDDSSYDDEEEGGGIGGKILLFIGVLIGIVALVGGGLWYVTVQNAKSNDAKVVAAVKKQIEADMGTLEKIRAEAEKALKEVDGVLTTAEREIDGVAGKLKNLFEGTDVSRFMEGLKPPKTPELLAAEAALNPPAPGAAAPEGTNVQSVASAPAAPEAANVQPGASAPAETAETAETAEAPVKAPRFITDMQKHWGTAFSVMARALAVKKQVLAILGEIDGNVAGIEYTESVKARLMATTSSTKAKLDSSFAELKSIKTDAKKLKVALDRFYKEVKSEEVKKREKAEAQALADKRKKDAAERAQKEKERHEALLAEETAGAKASFDKLVSEGVLRRLYWEGAERELKSLAESFQTPEARRRIYDVELKKVQMMKSVHDIFISNLKANGGYVFTATFYKNKFLNKKVVSVDKDKIVLINKDGKGAKTSVMWQAVYSDYPLIMNELWNKFILKGRDNGVKKLSLREWADAQLGFAMTLKLICSNADGADKVSEYCALEAVKKLPNYKNLAVETFPGVDFSVIEAEAAANNM